MAFLHLLQILFPAILTTLPKVLTPKVNHDFVLEEVSSSFVRKELLQMNSSEATGLDGISARLLKDAAS